MQFELCAWLTAKQNSKKMQFEFCSQKAICNVTLQNERIALWLISHGVAFVRVTFSTIEFFTDQLKLYVNFSTVSAYFGLIRLNANRYLV